MSHSVRHPNSPEEKILQHSKYPIRYRPDAVEDHCHYFRMRLNNVIEKQKVISDNDDTIGSGAAIRWWG